MESDRIQCGTREIGARQTAFRKRRIPELLGPQPALIQLAPEERGSLKDGLFEAGLRQLRLREGGAFAPGLVQLRPGQLAPQEPGVAERAARQVGVAQLAMAQRATCQVRARQARTGEIDLVDQRAGKIEPAHVPTPAIRLADRNAMPDVVEQFIPRHSAGASGRRAGQTLACCV
ncbi:hypothetical protein FQZ97_880730 [compost metagenome]